MIHHTVNIAELIDSIQKNTLSFFLDCPYFLVSRSALSPAPEWGADPRTYTSYRSNHPSMIGVIIIKNPTCSFRSYLILLRWHRSLDNRFLNSSNIHLCNSPPYAHDPSPSYKDISQIIDGHQFLDSKRRHPGTISPRHAPKFCMLHSAKILHVSSRFFH